MTANKIHNRLEQLIDSLIITENQKSFLQKKANDLFNELKSISQNQIPYWSSLYLSRDTYQYILKRFWFGKSLDMGFFLKNRFDVNIYFVYGQYNTYPNKQNNFIGSMLFELLYSHLKVYQFNHREHMKILKEPPYGYAVPIRIDYPGISILFDCIPAIELHDSYLIIPNGTGDTKKLNPKLEEQALSELNKKQNGRITKLIILLKYWNFNWGKPIKGYLIERLIEYIFDKNKVQSWNQAVKTFFNRTNYILNKEKFLPDRVVNQYSILEEYPSIELKDFREVFIEAENYAQKGKWEDLFSDL